MTEQAFWGTGRDLEGRLVQKVKNVNNSVYWESKGVPARLIAQSYGGCIAGDISSLKSKRVIIKLQIILCYLARHVLMQSFEIKVSSIYVKDFV
jgi:hypothetical protein